MTITSIPTAAALRSSVSTPTQVPPFVPSTGADAWRDRSTRMPVQLVNHNSIVAGVGHGAAKQAAPPRGVPR